MIIVIIVIVIVIVKIIVKIIIIIIIVMPGAWLRQALDSEGRTYVPYSTPL